MIDHIDLFHVNSSMLINQISSVIGQIDWHKDDYKKILSKHLDIEGITIDNLIASYHPKYNTNEVTCIKYMSNVDTKNRVVKLDREIVLNRFNQQPSLLYIYVEEYDVIYELVYNHINIHISPEIKEKHHQVVRDRLRNKSS